MVMKISLPVMLLFLTASCGSANKMNTQSLKGKLVISELCGHYVVQLIAGNIDTNKLAINWHDDKRGATYPQSFKVANVCSFGKEGLKEGDEFTFSVSNTPEKEQCAVCLAYYPVPTQSLTIDSIKKTSSN